jgi:hypothetical protein
MAVERKAAARAERVTAFLCGESRKTSAIGSILLNIRKKHPIRREARGLRHHHGEIAAGLLYPGYIRGGFTYFRPNVIPGMNG